MNRSTTALAALVLVVVNELVLGNLLFESPTRLWDNDTFALGVRYDGAGAILPIERR